MTNSELSNEFDILYNNITSNQAPGLNEYEKSVFLTKAQSQLVNEYFNNRTDGFGGGFDGSQKRQYDFSSIIKVATLDEIPSSASVFPLDSRSILFAFPDDYFLAINEIIEEKEEDKIIRQYSVIPINHLDYQRLMLKPYNLPAKKAVWRLLNGTITSDKLKDPTKDTPTENEPDVTSTEGNTNDPPIEGETGDTSTTPSTPTTPSITVHSIAECIGSFRDSSTYTLSYKLRYVKSLSPIILEDLSEYGGEEVTIGGESGETSCELPEETHQEILERAVTLAKIAWQGATATQVARQQDKE